MAKIKSSDIKGFLKDAPIVKTKNGKSRKAESHKHNRSWLTSGLK